MMRSRLLTNPYAWLLSLLMVLACTELSAMKEGHFINVGKDARYLQLPSDLDVHDAYGRLNEFTFPLQDVHNLGLTDRTQWIYVDLSATHLELEKLCQLEPRMTSYVIYAIEGEELSEVYRAGMELPFCARDISVSPYIFKIPEQSSRRFLISLRSPNNRNIPLYLADEQGMDDYLEVNTLINGMYFGLLVIMILYNTFIYFTVRDRDYLFYILFLISMGFTQAYMSGLLEQFIFPEITYLKVMGSAIYPPLTGVLAIVFIIHLLDTRNQMPGLHRFLLFSALLYAAGLVIGNLRLPSLSYALTQSANLVGSLVIFVGAIVAVRKGVMSGKYILMGWTFIIIGVICYVFTENGAMGYRPLLSSHYIQIGSGFEVLFFSFALADRINQYRRGQMEAEIEKQRLLQEKAEQEQKTMRRLAELELQALRGQMNPHFVFNALSSIQYYINNNEPENAEKYLTRFARLIRFILNSSKKKFITLDKEVQMLKIYTDLEMMRFEGRFTTTFDVEDELELDEIRIPSMITQPLVENAIDHGLRDRSDGKGEIHVIFRSLPNGVLIKVTDNGVGFNQEKGLTDHDSRGLDIIKERLALIPSTGYAKAELKIEELDPENETFPGSIVTVEILENEAHA